MKAVLSGRSRAAVAALVFMLADGNKEDPYSLHIIANKIGASLSYMEQIFAKLREAQLVVSVRGPGGGYLLYEKSGDLTITDVVLALAPDSRKNAFQMLICKQLDNIKLAQLVHCTHEIF
ncbi:Rrf2 family transcriptional regulator [Enterobacter hormaechei]